MSNDRIIGLDLGTKTLGISMSDITKTVANSFDTIRFNNEDYSLLIKPLKEIIEEYNVSKIVLGFPKNMNNTIGMRAEITMEFKEILESNIDIDVVMQDERLSSKAADLYMLEGNVSRKKRKQKKDSLAANIILQSYLDRRDKNGK